MSSFSPFARRFALAAVVFFALCGPRPAAAVPLLQLYVEGATYDQTSETWLLERAVDQPFRVWAVGNVDGPGGKGDLSDVRMSLAYSANAPNVQIGITPTTTNGLGGFTDPSVPQGPVLLGTYVGGSPELANGKSLPTHGEYGDGTAWQEWALGDMTLTDSPIADFVDAFPAAPVDPEGQINAYEINVSGLLPGQWLHIDLYGSIESKNKIKAVFAPFSHDAGSTTTLTGGGGETISVPAPDGSLILLAALGLLARRRRLSVTGI